MNYKVFFRVDANKVIGRGHLSRCLAMAVMLKEEFEICFISLKQNSIQAENLVPNYSVKYLEQEQDIFDIISNKIILVLDGYQFSEDYKKLVQSEVYKLIEINDIPYEAKHVDMIINHTPGISKEQFGQTSAELCLGLDYALLRKSFLNYAKRNPKSDNDREGVFVCFGGADTYKLGFKFVQSLLEKGFQSPIYWVTNQSSANYNFENHVEILYQLYEEEIIQYMLKSKVLIIPSSVLSIEAIALRKPFFTGYFVDNQKLIFDGLQKNNLAKCFGYFGGKEYLDLATKVFLDFYVDHESHKIQTDAQKNILKGDSGRNLMIALNILCLSA